MNKKSITAATQVKCGFSRRKRAKKSCPQCGKNIYKSEGICEQCYRRSLGLNEDLPGRNLTIIQSTEF